MACYFDRKTGLYLGSFENVENKKQGLDISDLDVDFEVTRSIVWYENSAKFTIYNPSERTINAALYDVNGIIFDAGYKDGAYGTIFVGNIYKAFPEIDGNDIVLKIIATSTRGLHYQLVNVPIELSFPEGTTLYAILKTIADYTAMPLMGAEEAKNITTDEPFIVSGAGANARTALLKAKELAMMWDGDVYFDNGCIVFLASKYREYNEEVNFQVMSYVDLAYDRGLLSCTPIRDESLSELNSKVDENLEFYFTGDLNKWKEVHEKTKDNRKRVNFSAMINPGIIPNSKVRINTENGRIGIPVIKDEIYIVHKAVFTGNNYGGAFQVNCEAALEER